MNKHVNAIAGRLSLRAPQRRSLEILDRIMEIAPPGKNADAAEKLAAIQSEYPSVADFEREFPSLCFALATGVGKTRLMGAFISYLHLAYSINNFFVLAPNLTIYNKLIADFTPNTPKYVFKGIAEFATDAPSVITGDNYDGMAVTLFDEFLRCKINIFNISKINSEVRGGKSPRIKRLSEYIGQSYFDYLAGLPDLVLIMDESHRYRASAGVRAINDLKPILGLELTATPFVETGRGPQPFKNVIYDYPLGRAMADGFVKEPAVVTRKNFNPSGLSPEEIERMKLEDGVRLHESVKVELETYARESGNPIVKPFLLVIARDTTHAGALIQLIRSEKFFEGTYRDKVIQVDSSRTGREEEEMIERLLQVESTSEPTEIVIHVNMLKEGWDVTNLYTIVPLRAANARILIEQSIGRGLRLPYGKRTGVTAVDRLNIVPMTSFRKSSMRPIVPIRLFICKRLFWMRRRWQRRQSRWCHSRIWRQSWVQTAPDDRQHRGCRGGSAARIFPTGRTAGGANCLGGYSQTRKPAEKIAGHQPSEEAGNSSRNCPGGGSATSASPIGARRRGGKAGHCRRCGQDRGAHHRTDHQHFRASL
jgi:DNA or RNA helicases of superfamily II